MKYFSVKNNNVYFLNQNNEELSIDKINKNDIIYFIELAISDDFEMDEYNDSKIGNTVHNIIYKNIYEKLYEIHKDRKIHIEMIEKLYENELAKYKK